MFSLQDQTAIITGGANGIGAATADILASCGANIVIVDVNETAGREKVAALTAKKCDATYVGANVSDPNDVSAMVCSVLDRYGSLEILMHFAGVGVEHSVLDTTLEEWNRLISINLTGSFLVMQAAARAMVDRKYGRIVAMASAAGLRGGSGRTAYAASKGGVIAMMQVMALELAQSGITVNALAPGAIETELVKGMHDDETRRAYLAGIPMDRYGTPEEVAAAAAYLAMPESGYITGVTLPVDGGFVSSGVIKNLRDTSRR